MTKMKRFFQSPRRAVLFCSVTLLLLTIVGLVTVYAVRSIEETRSIGTENARNFACVDAGIDPAAAQGGRADFAFEQGQFVYKVSFTANGTEYEYWVKASSGAIVKKNIRLQDPSAEAQTTGAPSSVTLEQAKTAALEDAGLAVSAVTFRSAEEEKSGEGTVYRIVFSTEDTQFEYKISAETGEVCSKSRDRTVRQTAAPTETPKATAVPAASAPPASAQKPGDAAGQPAQSGTGAAARPQTEITAEAARDIALADAGVSRSSVNFTKTERDHNGSTPVYEIAFRTADRSYEYEIDSRSGRILDRESESESAGQKPSGGGSTYIGVDRAKEIAVSHAGLPLSGVTFAKAKLDKEDGRSVYELEFHSGDTDYEYTIDALTGGILESERDSD